MRTKFLVVVLMGATLLFGCSAASDTTSTSSNGSTSSNESTKSSADTTISTTGETEKTDETAARIGTPEYDPLAVQPEGWPKLDADRVRKAVNIALQDPRLEDFLRRNNFEVDEVRKTESMHYRPATTDISHPAARVTVVLDDPVPLEQSGYEGDICDVGGATGPVTGMVWVVDLVEESVAAVSPQWNYDVSCT